ncbi:MAG: HD-GYP domain-containing protein [Treponema sp.]|jgi:HD-GYP domain-containing protein (c-di-GMP phosphodiesterase class II)|nr:HD-GYP domain-containing protein [Treponema sp.]
MKVPVDSLRPGVIYSEPVYIEGENLLVPAGVALRKKDIDRLNSWGIKAVETNGQPMDAVQKPAKKPTDLPSISDLAKSADKSEKVISASANVMSLAEVQGYKGIYRSYLELIERLDQVFMQIGSGISAEARSVDNITARLLQAVREQRNSFIGYILGGEVSGFELAKSSVNTAILSAFIATELKQPNHRVMQVVTGALLHDIGMLRLPKELVNKKGGLSDAEIQKMQAHSLYGYRIITKELLYPEDVGIIAFQHHERWDGEGYPRKVVGAAIDMGARIVSVTDAFEAMVSKKSYRNSMVGYQAMKNLLSDNSRRFDPDVLKAFIQTMGIYPIGSIILLNNGAMARVVDVQGTAPLRPKIQILIDKDGKTYKQGEGEFIDLLKDKQLFISRAVDPKEYASDKG